MHLHYMGWGEQGKIYGIEILVHFRSLKDLKMDIIRFSLLMILNLSE